MVLSDALSIPHCPFSHTTNRLDIKLPLVLQAKKTGGLKYEDVEKNTKKSAQTILCDLLMERGVTT